MKVPSARHLDTPPSSFPFTALSPLGGRSLFRGVSAVVSHTLHHLPGTARGQPLCALPRGGMATGVEPGSAGALQEVELGGAPRVGLPVQRNNASSVPATTPTMADEPNPTALSEQKTSPRPKVHATWHRHEPRASPPPPTHKQLLVVNRMPVLGIGPPFTILGWPEPVQEPPHTHLHLHLHHTQTLDTRTAPPSGGRLGGEGESAPCYSFHWLRI